jgi:uncharacterized protein
MSEPHDAPTRLIATVAGAWTYPVKSLQGQSVGTLDVRTAGIAGDRRWGIVPDGGDKVLSAKREPALLDARVTSNGTADGETIVLPDGTTVATSSPEVHAVLSAWLGRPVRLCSTDESDGLAYEMTFDPPDDTAELFDIPVPPGTFLDYAPVHLITTATLSGCASARPDLDWDVRRFRPNLLIDVDGPTFLEDSWTGHQVRIGEVVLSVMQPTVRCAMPLRAQPALGDAPALERRPDLYQAMTELNTTFPNHLGVYAGVVVPGTIRVGDAVDMISAG